MPKLEIYEHLYQQMKALDYTANPNGSCLGFARMGRQAIHLREVAKFKARLQYLLALPVDALKNRVIESRKMPYNSANLAIEIPAFFESMLVNQSPKFYSYLVESTNILQDETNILPLLLSKKLEKKSGIVKSELLSGVYNLDELQTCLAGLADSLSKAVPSITEPLALILTSGTHALCLGFDPISHTWSFIEIAQFPSEWDKHHMKRLSEKVIEAFSRGCGLRKMDKILNVSESFFTRSQYILTDTELFFFSFSEKTLHQIPCNLEILKEIESIFSDAENKAIEVLDSDQLNLIATLTNHSLAASEYGVFSIEISACKQDEPSFIKAIDTWKSSQDWKNIHAVSEQKAKFKDSNGVTWLHLAALRGQFSIVQQLIHYQANINLSYIHPIHLSVTPLIFACVNNHFEMAELLLKNGAEINDWTGKEPLYFAIECNHADIVKLLINNNAPLTHLFYNYLGLAISSQNQEIIHFLLEKGAPVTFYGHFGQDYLIPIHEAIRIKDIALIETLIARGADVNQIDASKVIFPLILALYQESYDIAKLLLKNGANINFSNPAGLRAIDFATAYNSFEMVSFLLEAEQKVDLGPNTKGITPLDNAIANKNLYMIKSLLLKNAQASQANQALRENDNLFFKRKTVVKETSDNKVSRRLSF